MDFNEFVMGHPYVHIPNVKVELTKSLKKLIQKSSGHSKKQGYQEMDYSSVKYITWDSDGLYAYSTKPTLKPSGMFYAVGNIELTSVKFNKFPVFQIPTDHHGLKYITINKFGKLVGFSQQPTHDKSRGWVVDEITGVEFENADEYIFCAEVIHVD